MNRRLLLAYVLAALMVLVWAADALKHPRDLTLAAAAIGVAVLVAGMLRRYG